jgi:hypothetical protein
MCSSTTGLFVSRNNRRRCDIDTPAFEVAPPKMVMISLKPDINVSAIDVESLTGLKS